MTKAVVDHFIMPLSACFTVRPGQDFEMFAKQLIDDLKSYSEPVLDEAVVTLRRMHKSTSWPPIAICVEAAREAAHRQYVPPEPEPESAPRLVPMPRVALDPGGSMLSQSEMRSCPIGTQFWACDATIRYPDGTSESWGQFRRRRRLEREPEEAA